MKEYEEKIIAGVRFPYRPHYCKDCRFWIGSRETAIRGFVFKAQSKAFCNFRQVYKHANDKCPKVCAAMFAEIWSKEGEEGRVWDILI